MALTDVLGVAPPFGVCGYKVISERMHDRASYVQAIVEVRVGQSCVSRSATGVGPVHALDNALRSCLTGHFPQLEEVRLSDYNVSVIDAVGGTGAHVRVRVEATDGCSTWDATCVSENVIEASFDALCSTAIVGIRRGSAAQLTSA